MAILKLLRNSTIFNSRSIAITKINEMLAELGDGELCVASYGTTGNVKSILGLKRNGGVTLFDNESNAQAITDAINALDVNQTTKTDSGGFVSTTISETNGKVSNDNVSVVYGDYAATNQTNGIATTSSTKTYVDTALNGKQDTLTFDNAPTANSNNPVKSSGIKTALDSKADNDNIIRVVEGYINDMSDVGGTKGSYDIEFYNYDHQDPKSRRLFGVQIPVASIVDAGDGEIDAIDGIISWDDYLKLYNIEEEANKTIVDSALSTTSTNPVENKVVKTALDSKQDTLTFDNAPTANSNNPVKSGGVKTALDTKGDTLSHDTDAGGINLKLKSGNTQLSTVTIPYADNPDVGDTYGGLMYKTDKTKLDGIEAGANKTIVDNVLSDSSSNPVGNSVITQKLKTKFDEYEKYIDPNGIDLYFKADGEYVGNWYIERATTTDAGVMSAADKTKLDGIASGATAVTVDSTLNKTSNNAISNTAVSDVLSVKEELYALKYSTYRNHGFYRTNGTFSNNSSYRYSDYIDIEGYKKLYIHTRTGSASVCPAVFFDSELTYISGLSDFVGTESDYVVDIPSNAKYVISSCVTSAIDIFKLEAEGFTKHQKAEVIYVSANGSDTNNGLTSSSPIYSFNCAKNKLKRNGKLIFLEGDYENYEMDFGWFSNIIGKGTVRFINYLDKVTSAESVSGYSNVYSATLTIPYASAISSQGKFLTKFIYQHNIADTNTQINTNEIHPLHKGRTHRLPSTRLYVVESITEVENATLPSFYYDNDTKTLYFSNVNVSNLSTNPIYIPHTVPYTSSELNHVNISNISILYKNLLTTNLSGTLSNISIGMCYGMGAFRLDNTNGLELINCEAYACQNDGFNTHNIDLNITEKNHITLIDCYAHDNSDDGESCHENTHMVVYGGLFEYNGNGCTPATGGSAEYYNVLVRQSANHPWVWDYVNNDCTGFSCQGTSTAPSKSSMTCYNCISENNAYGFKNTLNYGESYAYNCIAKNNNTLDYSNVTVKNTTSVDTTLNSNSNNAISNAAVATALGDIETILDNILGT